jgi:hypothetical protein
MSALNAFPPAGVSKPLLVDAVNDPDLRRIAALPKRGFTVPLATWLRAPEGLQALRTLAADAHTNAFAGDAVARSLERFARGSESVYSVLSLLTAARWLTRHGIEA